ncbi:sterol glucosyltransferase, partial [Aureobasidium melanogenum]
MKGHGSIDSDSTLSEDFEAGSLPPPRYDQIYHASHDPETAELGAEGPYHIRDDGRVDIDFNSSIIRAFSKCFPSAPDEDSQPAPPAYESKRPFDPSTASSLKWNIKLNIVIQVVGSRGDVQPFIVLGTKLQRYGHRVRIATHDIFAAFVRQAGLEFYPIGGDPASLMAYMVKNPSLIPSMKTIMSGEIGRKRQMVAEMLAGCWDSCVLPDQFSGQPFVADAIIANPPSFAHVHCAQALGIPVHLMFTMPWTSTRSFPHPLANLTNVDESHAAANYMSYHVVELMTWQGLGDVINDWRESIELEPVNFLDGPALAQMLKIPFTYCFSPGLVPKPKDWPDYVDVCGFFFRCTPAYTPESGLVDFLAAGPPPVYFGFGSIVLDDPAKMLSTILGAVKAAGVRAIISKGWSDLGGDVEENVYYIGDCPHEWLFPRVAAVVHHGGAGTTACSLKNGRPTLVCPFFGDQPFWGHMIANSGAGPDPLPPRCMTVNTLAEAIRFLMRKETALAAEVIAERMDREQGVQAAVNSFHRHLPLGTMQCDLIPDQPAVWAIKSGRREVKLSKLAAEIVISQRNSLQKDLKTYKTKPLIIDPIRWEPLSGGISASVGTTVDIGRCLTGMVTEPIKAYSKERRRQDRVDSTERFEESQQPAESSSSIHTVTSTKSRGKQPSAGGKAALAGAKSLGWLAPKAIKGATVDIPLALAEGFRILPKLYGDEVRDHGRVTGAASGFAVGGKTFAYGLFDGIAGLGVQPYNEYKKSGAVGIATGLGKGLAGLVTKPGAAMVGAWAYPAAGIAHSVRSAVYNKARKLVEVQRAAEGQWLAEQQQWTGSQKIALMEKFNELGSKK